MNKKKGLKLDEDKRKVLEEVILAHCSSMDSFRDKLSATAEEMRCPNSYMYGENVDKYLSGKLPVTTRPARAMLETLKDDERLDFLREVAAYKLTTD